MTAADRLVASGHDVLYVGTPDGLESRLVHDAGIEFIGIAARGYDRARPLTLVTSSALMVGSTAKARRLVKKSEADVVVGFGGYVSIPVGAAAAWLSAPLVLFEQNSVPGMANVFLSRWAQAVGVTYEVSSKYLKHADRVHLTGNPVRSAVLDGDRAAGRVQFGVPVDARMLLVFGGSRGARHINSAVISAAPTLLGLPDLHVVHITGPSEYDSVVSSADAEGLDRERYHIRDYVESMGSALAAADLVISRAGATSIAEITALGKPAVLVPYPYATDDHQTLNAHAVVEAGGARLVPDAEIESQEFIELVTSLMEDPGERANMAAASASLGRPDAAERVERLIADAATKRVAKANRESE